MLTLLANCAWHNLIKKEKATWKSEMGPEQDDYS